MSHFNLVRSTIDFDRHGCVGQEVWCLVFRSTNLREVFTRQAVIGEQSWPTRNRLVEHKVVDRQGKHVSMSVLYEQEIGPDIFAAQLADETFFIDLDVWFKNTLQSAAFA